MAVQPIQQLNLDESQQKGFVGFFKALPEKAATTVRLFDRGEYYTAHGSDAVLAAQLVFNTTAAVKQIGATNNTIESLVLKKANFDTLVKELLLVQQYRVEVYCNKSSSKSANNWVLEYKGSPGNLSQFEDLLWSNAGSQDSGEYSGSVAMAICLYDGRRGVALAMVDPAERQLKVIQFADDEQLTALEGLVVQMAPKECLIPETTHEELRKLLERIGILVTPKKRLEWNAETIAQDLNRLINFQEGQQHNSLVLPEMNLTNAIGALAALIKYLELLGDASNESQFSLSTLKLSGFVRLDAAAVKALNLQPSPRATNRQQSILGLLDRCRTAQGHRLLARWLVQPLRDLNAISERHDVVSALLDDLELRQELTDEHLRRMPDLVALGNKMSKSKLTLQDCYKVYMAVTHLPKLISSLSQAKHCAAIVAMFITPLEEMLQDLERFVQMVETTLDLEMVQRGEFLVKPGFDDDLKDMRNEMDEIEARLKKQVNRAAGDLGLEAHKSIKLESNSQFGYFYRVTLKEDKCLRNNKSYHILDSHKGGIRFRDDRLTELNDTYVSLRESYAKHQSAIVQEIIGIASGYCGVVRRLGTVVAQLDVLTSFALVAAAAPTQYVRPIMRKPDDGILKLIQARHPCVELQDDISYIANDVQFKQGETTKYIVTGPNMGGKSTFIRSVGVVVLMAQIGSFVPCNDAEISVVDAILARVGADDCLLKGMSTFMNEMVETAALLRTATKHSLVIIDELGRGTSTYDGCGIAWAIAEHLASDLKSFTLFATHFHELTVLPDQLPNVANRHVSAKAIGDTLTLLYTIKPGFCDKSFGLHVAKMAKFPEHVLDYAQKKQNELEVLQVQCNNPQDTKEGEELMEQFLLKCKQLVESGVNQEQLAEKVQQLKDEVVAKNNSYINSLVK